MLRVPVGFHNKALSTFKIAIEFTQFSKLNQTFKDYHYLFDALCTRMIMNIARDNNNNKKSLH